MLWVLEIGCQISDQELGHLVVVVVVVDLQSLSCCNFVEGHAGKLPVRFN